MSNTNEWPKFENPETSLERKANVIADELHHMEKSMTPGKMREYLHLQKRFQEVQACVLFGGVNPKEMETSDLLDITRMYSGHDHVSEKYKKRIRSPLTAIRSFCVICMGGSVPEVRRCSSTNCPNWPFRMGKNPFYAMPDAEAETTEDIEDDGNQKAVGTVVRKGTAPNIEKAKGSTK